MFAFQLKSARTAAASLIAFLASVSAFADLPLTALLDSSAGRLIFSQSERGGQIAARILGAEVALESRNAELARYLLRPEMRELNQVVTTRLNRVRDRFNQRFPQSAEVFGANARALTREETVWLRRLVSQEMDRGFLEFIPERLPGEALDSAAAQAAFLVGDRAVLQTPTEKLLAMAANPTLLHSDAVVAYEHFGRALLATPELAQLLPTANVHRLLADEEMTGYVARFKDVMQRMADPAAAALSTPEKLKAAIRGALENKVPASTIEARIEALKSGTTAALHRAMGDMTLAETQLLMHGGNPLAPTPDSLLGKYLAETGATSIVRTFPKGPAAGPGATNEQGPARLVVAISTQTLPTYLKYFSIENLLSHVHTPNQGTLLLSHEGKTGTYANLSSPFRAPTPGTLMPQILFKSTEAQRLSQFFKHGASRSPKALLPWDQQGYCATGGYSSCTHWVGNIPIGDTLVTEYRFPGAIDQWAYNRVPDSPAPRVQKLAPYVGNDPLAQRVWKFPGNQQLADTLGLAQQNLAGELANPGWVAHVLTGVAPLERVPTVFLMTENAHAPIAVDFPHGIRAQ